ncbi:hypothetical protein ACP4OV_014695 [Aristida adscensionis]
MGNETSKSNWIPKSTDFGTLENMLQDPCEMPMFLPIDFLKAITHDFSEEKELGRGGYGVVYKGVLGNGKAIAVKKLSEMHLDDAQFQNEVTYLFGLKHKNIVQLVGYCAESRWEATQLCGKYVMGEIRKRLLCFEYLNNRSLDKHLSGESCGLEWNKRYEIIRGICCGLRYLHEECHILHLDLKPANILLDDNMLPKIADFGMSRLFGQDQSRIITGSRGGTFGYMAPEYLNNGLISTKSDTFSLGVIIIELMTGSKDYPQSSEASFGHFVENVVGNWRDRLERTLGHIPLELYCQQLNTCIMIGLKCVDPDPKKRPAALDIIQMLNAVESTDMWTSESQIIPFSSHSTANSINSEIEILNSASTSVTANIFVKEVRSVNISSVFTFSSKKKGRIIAFLAFEVANTIVKSYSLMKILSKQNIKHLKERIVLKSEGVYRLIPGDQSQLLVLFEADIREELRQFLKEVARFGNQCKDPRWHNLDRYLLFRLQELYRELIVLDKYEYEFREFYEKWNPDHTTRSKHELNDLHSAVKKQRNVVKKLKKESLWRKTMEDIVEKLVDFAHFMHVEINVFMRNLGDQSIKPVSNLPQTLLGPAGLALHYANIILQINMLALAVPMVIPQKDRDALYQALPHYIRSKMRAFSRRENTTITLTRDEMDRVLRWLVPVAELTRFYYKNGAFGEWAKGMEELDMDEAHWSGQEKRQNGQITANAMLRHVNAKVNKIETLYYADKEATEGYILDLLRALHCLVQDVNF